MLQKLQNIHTVINIQIYMNKCCSFWSASSRQQLDFKSSCSPAPPVSCDWTLARSSLKPSRVSTGSYCFSVPLWGGPNDQVGQLKDAAGPDGFKVCLFCHKQDVFQQLRWNNFIIWRSCRAAASSSCAGDPEMKCGQRIWASSGSFDLPCYSLLMA